MRYGTETKVMIDFSQQLPYNACVWAPMWVGTQQSDRYKSQLPKRFLSVLPVEPCGLYCI